MNTHEHPLGRLTHQDPSTVSAAALHDYGAAWCGIPEDRPQWMQDEVEHDLSALLSDDDVLPSDVVALPKQDPDLIRRLGQAIRTTSMIPADTLDTRASVAAEAAAIIEVDFSTWPSAPQTRPKKPARRGLRVTSRLDADDTERLLTAYGRGRLMGLDWTAFLTVAWATIGITTDDQVSAAMASLMIRLREWATRSKDVTGAVGIPAAWIWVHERGPLCGKLHTHMLLSVPRKKRALLGRVVLHHLERYSGQKLTQGSDHTPQTSPDEKEWPSGSPQIGMADFSSVTGAFSSTLHITAPRNDKTAKIFAAKRLRYMAKSIDPHTAIQLTTGARVGLAD